MIPVTRFIKYNIKTEVCKAQMDAEIRYFIELQGDTDVVWVRKLKKIERDLPDP